MRKLRQEGDPLDLIASVLACGCGTDDTASIREEFAVQQLAEDDKAVHPWRYWHTPEDEAGVFEETGVAF